MPFVRRDASGKVIAAYSDATGQAGEEVSAYDPELDRFLGRNDVLDPDWHKSDAELARVIEDLVAVLLDKGVIDFADLPEAARGKFLEREERRGQQIFSQYADVGFNWSALQAQQIRDEE
jgi:hypothetical protein